MHKPLAAALATLFIFAIAGCGSEQEQGGQQNTTQPPSQGQTATPQGSEGPGPDTFSVGETASVAGVEMTLQEVFIATNLDKQPVVAQFKVVNASSEIIGTTAMVTRTKDGYEMEGIAYIGDELEGAPREYSPLPGYFPAQANLTGVIFPATADNYKPSDELVTTYAPLDQAGTAEDGREVAFNLGKVSEMERKPYPPESGGQSGG